MKIFAATMLLALTGMVIPASAVDPAPPVPRKAPEFVFNLQDGKQLLLSSFRGKVVAIAFMFTTCPHCQALCPILANIQKDYTAKGVQFVGDVIDEGAREGLPQFTQLYSKNAFPVGWSTQAAALEFLKHPDPRFYVPMMAFVDKKGMIESQHIGDDADFFGNQDKSIRAELDKILAGTLNSKTPAPKSFSKTITSGKTITSASTTKK
jgi:thiol-disulfide isomerase/thioredoxin